MDRYADRDYAPDFDDAERQRAKEPRHQLARELARNLHKLVAVKEPPVDVEAIVRMRGLTLVPVDVASTLSGALYPKEREIVVNTRGRTLGRRRFTISHELGHWELRHWELADLPQDTLGYSGVFEGDGSSEGRSSVEIEANTFAAELLMPGAWVRKLPKSLAPGLPHELAERYQVSEEAMFYQLMRCGRL